MLISPVVLVLSVRVLVAIRSTPPVLRDCPGSPRPRLPDLNRNPLDLGQRLGTRGTPTGLVVNSLDMAQTMHGEADIGHG
ncbi:MAG: hypothetical protein GY926_19160 [bacterium]|nr:hypothetical protein [bacterium]